MVRIRFNDDGVDLIDLTPEAIGAVTPEQLAQTQAQVYVDFEDFINVTIQNAIGNALRSGVQFILGGDAGGDLYFRSASGPLARLGIGSNGQALVVSSGLPAWGNISSLSWSVLTGTSQAAVVNSGYIVNAASLCTITLPATAAVGSILEVAGMGAGGWRVGQAAGQQIFFGSVSNTSGTGGQLNSTHQRDCIRLVCITQDTTWQVVSSVGNIDVI